MGHPPWRAFQRWVERCGGNRKVKWFGCPDPYRCMAFAQITCRESPRAQSAKLYRMGIGGGIPRSTLANANQVRDWRIHAGFAQRLTHTARCLYRDEDLGLELDNTAHALDSSTIDLRLTLFPRAGFREIKAAVKPHTLLDLRGGIPAFIHISDGKFHDVKVMDLLLPEAGAFYVMDRACLDFARLHDLRHTAASHAVMTGENLPLVGKLLGHRRHRARTMHTPFRGFSRAIPGPFRPGFSRIFRAICNYF